MKKNITIKNDVPHLLEAIWHHDDCPDWLQNVIWDGINNRTDGTKMSATYWASCLESAKPDDPDENEKRYRYGSEESENQSFPPLTVLEGGAQ